MVKRIYATFEISLLLRDKGFNEPCSHYYINNYSNFKYDGILRKTSLPNDLESDNILQFVKRSEYQPHLINVPEVWQVIEWLRVNYNIWINIGPKRHKNEKFENEMWYECEIWRLEEDEIKLYGYDSVNTNQEFISPEKAYLEAILYTLKNLI